MADVLPQPQQHIDVDNESIAGSAGSDQRNEQEKQKDNELAERLTSIIEDANSRVSPLCKMIRKVYCLSLVNRILKW